MRQPFDQLAKRLLRAVFGPTGGVLNQHEIAADALEIDTWFRPDPGRAAERHGLGILGQMGDEPSTVFEAFHGAPTLREYRGAVLKQLTLDRLQALDAHKVDAPLPPLPRLWVLSAGRPDAVLERYAFAKRPGWPAGFFERTAGDAIGLVVLRELPRERHTLLLRLLGAGPVLAEAVADLKALPDDAWERQIALPLLIALRFEIPQDPTDESDREFLMSTTDLYEYWKDHYKNEGVDLGVKQGHDLGVKQGHEQGVKSSLKVAYQARFGPMPEEIAAAVDVTHDPATLGRWLEIIVTSTPEEIHRALRGSTAS